MAAEELIVAAGMGRMGRGIAITFACAGLPVRLLDLKPRSAAQFAVLRDAAISGISDTLAVLVEVGLLKKDSIEPILARLSWYNAEQCQAALQNASIVFEGVPEVLQAKQHALDLIAQHVAADTLIASTTSTILSNELQAMVSAPERFLNAHWLNPAYLVPLVELSPGSQTDAATTARLRSLLESIGKVPVVCEASPGFIVPRIQMLAMNEAGPHGRRRGCIG